MKPETIELKFSILIIIRIKGRIKIMKRILTLVSMILAMLFVSSNAVSAEENTYDRVYMITVDRFLNNNSGNDV